MLFDIPFSPDLAALSVVAFVIGVAVSTFFLYRWLGEFPHSLLGGIFFGTLIAGAPVLVVADSWANDHARDVASVQLKEAAEDLYGVELSEEEAHALVAELSSDDLSFGLGVAPKAVPQPALVPETENDTPMQLLWTGKEWALADASEDVASIELERR